MKEHKYTKIDEELYLIECIKTGGSFYSSVFDCTDRNPNKCLVCGGTLK